MESLLEIFSAFGLSASAGMNAYIPLLVIALMARFTDLISLQSPWDALSSWWIISLLIGLSIIEFLVDKFPVVNHINDLFIQSFVRPTAGAIAFAASTNVVTDIHPVLALALGLLISGSVHIVKATAIRPAITATTAGTANVPVSVAEDVTSTTLSILSVVVPIAVLVIAFFFFSWIIWHFYMRIPEN
ncbi:MAG: DUF4126 domain-containing protein [Anaerolineaceae bacterium]|nr:DUF4126 domain-containing protein [Anaerolineaceae bacterium]